MATQFPPFPEVKQLLDSDEMYQYELAVANRIGLSLLPYPQAFPFGLPRLLYLANLSVQDARSILHSNKELLIVFSVRMMQEDSEDNPDGEFPAGEEQDPNDPNDTGQVLGLGKGFGIIHICYYLLASQEKAEVLLTFLQRTRIPYRQKFCTYLRKLYRAVQLPQD